MTKLRILLVEDSENDAELLWRHLEREGIAVQATRVETADAMREALGRQAWDVVISDYSMPVFSAMAARAVLAASGIDIPFIIVSGTIGEETAVSALKAGAHDFLTKGNLTRLVPAIQREMQDAVERRRLRAAEQALSTTRERLRFSLEAAGVGTWEWDVASGRVAWSDVLERLHGLQPGDFRGTFEAFLEVAHPEDRARLEAGREEFLASHTNTRVEYRVRWPDGSERWIESVGRAVHDASGRAVRAAGVAMDITAQKELEQQLHQSQKMESIGTLAGGIAHDFNNLLTAIAGYCELLAERPRLEQSVRQDLDEIRRAVASAADLTRQLLAFGRKQIFELRVVSLNDIVVNLSKMLRRLIEENVRLDLRLAPDLARVAVDPGQIEQAVVNLAVNARDAMPGGGTLTIATENVVLDESYAHTHPGAQPGPHVRLRVSDTGCGMSPDVQARVFEPFFTTKPKGRGTGLGLATVYGIVAQSGGAVAVASEPGRGTTFTVLFPAASAAPDVEPVHLKAAAATLNGTETILVVEDDAKLRALDERVLKRYGYRVLVAGSADEARQILVTSDAPIHVLLTDVIMPGASGRTIGDWVHEHRPGTKVVYMSGYTDDAIARHGVLEPNVHFLQKPFSPEALARKIREALS